MRRRQIPVLAVSAILAGAIGYGLTGTANAQGGDTHLRAAPRDERDPGGRPRRPGASPVRLHRGRRRDVLRGLLHRHRDTQPGHIHIGEATVNGGIVVPLFELVGMPADERNDALERGSLSDCVPADLASSAQIEANPGGFYCNLHNSRFPAGAIRGQLTDRG